MGEEDTSSSLDKESFLGTIIIFVIVTSIGFYVCNIVVTQTNANFQYEENGLLTIEDTVEIDNQYIVLNTIQGDVEHTMIYEGELPEYVESGVRVRAEFSAENQEIYQFHGKSKDDRKLLESITGIIVILTVVLVAWYLPRVI